MSSTREPCSRCEKKSYSIRKSNGLCQDCVVDDKVASGMVRVSILDPFPVPHYHVTVNWPYMESWLERHKEHGIDMDPPFQRGYIWTPQQKHDFVLYQLRGGMSGKAVYWNAKGWMKTFDGPLVLVDGKQRISAVREFLDNKLAINGYYCKDFADIALSDYYFDFYVNDLPNDEAVVDWYVGMNTGGSAHTEQDIKVALEYKNQLMNKR